MEIVAVDGIGKCAYYCKDALIHVLQGYVAAYATCSLCACVLGGRGNYCVRRIHLGLSRQKASLNRLTNVL